jgi:hypothetical protein
MKLTTSQNPPLAALYDLAQAIKDPSLDVSQRFDTKRLAIYQHLFFNNIFNTISTAFPVLKSLYTPDAWSAVVRDFFKKHVSHTPYFHQIGHEFLAYLEKEKMQHEWPFLLDLARYERAETDVFLKPIQAIIQPELTDNFIEKMPYLQPAYCLFESFFPVHQICAEHMPLSPLTIPVYLLLYRDACGHVKFQELSPVSAALFELIADNQPLHFENQTDLASQKNGLDLIQQLADALAFPPDKLMIHAQAQLQAWHQQSIILGVWPS